MTRLVVLLGLAGLVSVGCATLPPVRANELKSLQVCTSSDTFGPFRTNTAPVTKDARVERRESPPLPGSDPLYFAFQVYRHTLSATDGPRCQHLPTCSAYGVHAVRRHPVLGFALTVDRLWRAGRSSELRPMPVQRMPNGVLRLADPLDASDFWIRGLPAESTPEYAPPPPRQ